MRDINRNINFSIILIKDIKQYTSKKKEILERKKKAEFLWLNSLDP
jgi:hypothetical protein